MARRVPTEQQPLNPLGAPSVIGLEAGREAARRQQQRSKMHDSVVSGLGALVGVSVLAAAAYVGYSIYTEQQSSDRVEAEQRQVEIERERSGDGLTDAIDELEKSPRWNGPGNPSFGVGEGP